MITKQVLKRIAPNSNNQIISDLEKYFDKYLNQYGVNTHLRISHFLAQCAHESASFRTLEEYASGAAYEGRKDLGNTKPGDGRRYKGRGIIQLTGRANYREMSRKLNLPLEDNPELAKDPEVSVRTALEYWVSRRLNTLADKNDITTITKRINGGLNGFEDRKKYLARAKSAIPTEIKFDSREVETDIGETKYVAVRGDKGVRVEEIQKQLAKFGFKITIDGKFGPETSGFVKDFQELMQLKPTGLVDESTYLKLLEDTPTEEVVVDVPDVENTVTESPSVETIPDSKETETNKYNRILYLIVNLFKRLFGAK